jgi:hypothetical protein
MFKLIDVSRCSAENANVLIAGGMPLANAQGWIEDIRLGRTASLVEVAQHEGQAERRIRLTGKKQNRYDRSQAIQASSTHSYLASAWLVTESSVLEASVADDVYRPAFALFSSPDLYAGRAASLFVTILHHLAYRTA